MEIKDKPPAAFKTVAGILLAGTVICCIWYYASPCARAADAPFPPRLLQVMLYLMPAFSMAGVVWDTKQIARHRTVETVAAATSDILGLLLWIAIASSFLLRVLPQHYIPWLFPVAMVAVPCIATVGNGPLVNNHPNAVVKFVAVALVAVV